MSSEISEDYQRGRYDELVERHKELLQLYQNLIWQMQTTQLTSGSGVHGAQVNVYAGSKIEAKTITWAIGLASVAFSILAYFVGLVPVAFGVAITVFSVSFGIGLYLSKKKEDKENQPMPSLPNMPK
ncbi:MAG: hypothetical protein ABSF44_02445 [Candidatus Bathyarchaeia archaeon]